MGTKGESRQHSRLCQRANSVFRESPHVHRLHGQIHSWKTAKNVHSWCPWIFQWSGISCASSTINRGLWKEKGWNEGAFRDPLLGSAVRLAQASNATFTTSDQETFEHRNWCCPEFSISFLSLLSPLYHFKSSINAVCYQCPRPSKTSVKNFGSARAVVVPRLWRHLNVWLPSSAFLQMADTQFQST